jgi:hypothetical protein
MKFKLHGITCFFICIVFINAEICLAEETTEANKNYDIKTSENAQEISNITPFLNDINNIIDSLNELKFSSALYSLEALTALVKEKQTDTIKSFFPEVVDQLSIASWGSSGGDVGFESAKYVLYSSQLKDSDDNMIEFHVIHADPSIIEYDNILKKQKLINALEDTEIINIGDYQALEKKMEESNFTEHNIVISKDLMMNVIINGEISEDVVNEFYEKIKFEDLVNFVNK